MLKVFNLSLLCAFICSIPTVIGIFFEKTKRIETGIVLFTVDFIGIAVFLYVSCYAQTFWTLTMWMWIPLVINLVVRGFQKNLYEYEGKTIILLGGISLIALLMSFILKPAQNFIYIHEEELNVTYNISADEILARLDLNIMESSEFNKHFAVVSPEMRKIGGKDTAIYHIINKNTTNTTEYIPGYIVMEKNGTPKFISKRLYYDSSYKNGKNSLRKVRREFPNVYIGKAKLDVDDEYNIYMLYEYREKFFYTEIKKDKVSTNEETTENKTYGVIALNLNNGDVIKYPEDEMQDWMDFKTTD